MGDDNQNSVNSKDTSDILGESRTTVLKQSNLELKQTIKEMEEIVRQRDLYIDKISKEKLSIENEKVNYLKEITQKNNEILELKNHNMTLENQIKNITDENRIQLIQKEKEIEDLQSKLNELAHSHGVDEKIIKNLEELNSRCSFLKEELMAKNQELIELRSEYHSKKFLSIELEKELNTLNEHYLKVQEENNELKQKFDMINNKFHAAFTPLQLSNYLTNAIDSFNNQVNTSKNAVKYVINGMDIEFKGTMAKDDTNQIVLSAPDIASSSSEALSTIRLSIQAVPKQIVKNK